LPPATLGTFYAQTVQIAGLTPPLFFNGQFVLPPGLTAWAVFGASQFTIEGTPTTLGTFAIAITVTDVKFHTATVNYTLHANPRFFTLSPAVGDLIPDATVGAVYSQTFTVTGGTAPYTFAGTSLPDGLSLTAVSDSSFALSGSATGSLAVLDPFSVQVTDATGAIEIEPYRIQIDTPWYISPFSVPGGQVGQPYAQKLTFKNGKGAIQWSTLGAVPPGLSLDATGNLSGTPQQGGSFMFNVNATDAAGDSALQSYTVNVLVGTVTISPGTLLDGSVDSYYSQGLSADGIPPFSWSVSGSLPEGLSLDNNGYLNGTPSTPGSYSFTVNVTDSAGQTGSVAYWLTID
jgi:hypothetical protein